MRAGCAIALCRVLAGCRTVAAGSALVGLAGCAQVTGLSDYEDAVVGERLFSFESDAELTSWSFEGCDHERVPDVGGQNPGALRLSTTTEPCVAAARLAPRREPAQYSRLAIWLRAASYDTVAVGIDGVNNRVVICSPRTTIAPRGCSVTPAQGELGEGVLQLVDLAPRKEVDADAAAGDGKDAGQPPRGEMTQLTITLPPVEGDDVTLYVDDIWLK